MTWDRWAALAIAVALCAKMYSDGAPTILILGVIAAAILVGLYVKFRT